MRDRTVEIALNETDMAIEEMQQDASNTDSDRVESRLNSIIADYKMARKELRSQLD